VLRALDGVRLGRVLDVGCGDGTFAGRLTEHGGQVTGVDFAPTALKRARAMHPELEFVEPAPDGVFPFPDGSFDTVTCVNVLQHVADTQTMVSEIRRVLLPQGLLVLAVPFHGRVRNMLTAVRGFERHYDPFGIELRFFTQRSLRNFLRDFSFAEVAVAARGGMPVLRETLIATARRGGVGEGRKPGE
jgi:2-polyprenyl-6-hydroxyphenyl methylase/3-demethylubiquinone-9 3-methyltransferase